MVGDELSPQEIRVVELMMEGKTNKEIAVAMGLSPLTVKNYLGNIYSKLQVTRRAHAVAVYLQRKERRRQDDTLNEALWG